MSRTHIEAKKAETKQVFHGTDYLSMRWGVPLRTVQDMCKNKVIACIKIGRSYRVSDEAIAAFENQQ